MARDICETCGHPEVWHTDGRTCQLCISIEDMITEGNEVCKEFIPDAFNMWKENEEGLDEKITSDKGN